MLVFKLASISSCLSLLEDMTGAERLPGFCKYTSNEVDMLEKEVFFFCKGLQFYLNRVGVRVVGERGAVRSREMKGVTS